MEEPTIDRAERRERLGPGERLGAWFYTGAPGRLVSFSIDLGLTFAALGAYGAKRAWQGVTKSPRS